MIEYEPGSETLYLTANPGAAPDYLLGRESSELQQDLASREAFRQVADVLEKSWDEELSPAGLRLNVARMYQELGMSEEALKCVLDIEYVPAAGRGLAELERWGNPHVEKALVVSIDADREERRRLTELKAAWQECRENLPPLPPPPQPKGGPWTDPGRRGDKPDGPWRDGPKGGGSDPEPRADSPKGDSAGAAAEPEHTPEEPVVADAQSEERTPPIVVS